jgi:hypothetical protein
LQNRRLEDDRWSTVIVASGVPAPALRTSVLPSRCDRTDYCPVQNQLLELGDVRLVDGEWNGGVEGIEHVRDVFHVVGRLRTVVADHATIHEGHLERLRRLRVGTVAQGRGIVRDLAFELRASGVQAGFPSGSWGFCPASFAPALVEIHPAAQAGEA